MRQENIVTTFLVVLYSSIFIEKTSKHVLNLWRNVLIDFRYDSSHSHGSQLTVITFGALVVHLRRLGILGWIGRARFVITFACTTRSAFTTQYHGIALLLGLERGTRFIERCIVLTSSTFISLDFPSMNIRDN